MKAQVLSGGRARGIFREGGLQGGVHMINQPGQAREYAKQMIGNELITNQAPDGIICNKVL